MAEKTSVAWTFRRMGGLEQVMLRTADEWRHFEELDPKIWVALSCPAHGLRFDRRTLELMDNGDGRIRVQEIQKAVRWTVDRLVDPTELVERREELPLSSIREDTPEGRQLLASARRILRGLGKPEAESLSREDMAEAVEAAARATFNGDGVMVPRPELDEDVRALIEDVVRTLGGVKDFGGEQGADLPMVQRFMEQCRELVQWRKEVDAAAIAPLGEKTEAAFGLVRLLNDKIDDYFIRGDLAAYEPGSEAALNPSSETIARVAEKGLAGESGLAELPLAHSAAERSLPLETGVNPAWRDSVRAFRETVVQPLLGAKDSLSREDWATIRERFSGYAAIVDRKPPHPVESLGWERLKTLVAAGEDEKGLMARFAAVVQKDLDGRGEIEAIADVERLLLYHTHLYRLLMNFVSFADFYNLSGSTTFHIGILYIDGKSCHLCLDVDDVDRHAELAKLSQLCLVYCECTRAGQDPRKIVAAVTAGSAVLMLPGRHGIFVDNDGNEWDATLVKIVENPISIRAAMFAPYQRVARLLSQQVAKFAAAREQKAIEGATGALSRIGSPAPAAPGAAPAPFDIGRSMGIFAAIGLAMGAIGTALASIAGALLSLSWWQFPLLFLAIFGLVSGPSMFLAWMRLRQRTLGPVLDASGWAVNSQIPINLTLGRFLTDTAERPRTIPLMDDPFYQQPGWKKWIAPVVTLLVVILLGVGAWWGWQTWGDEIKAHIEKARQQTQQQMQQMQKDLTAPAAPETPAAPAEAAPAAPAAK